MVCLIMDRCTHLGRTPCMCMKFRRARDGGGRQAGRPCHRRRCGPCLMPVRSNVGLGGDHRQSISWCLPLPHGMPTIVIIFFPSICLYIYTYIYTFWVFLQNHSTNLYVSLLIRPWWHRNSILRLSFLTRLYIFTGHVCNRCILPCTV